MIYFYKEREDGTIEHISLGRIHGSELYVEASPSDFRVAQAVPQACKVVDGKLIIGAEAEAKAKEILQPEYELRVAELIRKEWTVDKELALINARDEEPDKYAAYRAKVAEIKAKAKRQIFGRE